MKEDDLCPPVDEKTLPPYLQESISYWLSVKDNRLRRDLGFEDLRASINMAQYGGAITKEEADYLRDKYVPLK